MESDSHEPGPGSGAADHGLVANLSAAELERLSAHYGPEVYSMVEDEKHREIIERNSAMRDAVKELGKSKLKARSKVDVAGDFITVPRESARRDNLGKPNKGGKAKRLRSVLGLKHFYNSLGRMHVSFWVMLDVELAKLLEWLAPSEEEREAKEMVLLQLEMVVAALFPKAQMHVFGSYVTGLSLPGGDIDVCIEGHGDELVSLKLLVYALSRMDLLHSFECVFNTPVPVVKAIDKHTGVKLDISIWQPNAISTTNLIVQKCTQFKYMQPLILLIKFFLQLRNLNDTYLGGIGSYLLYCMVLSFLQMHDACCRKSSDDVTTLSNMFVDFFYYWGFIRDYDQFVTTVRGLGHVYPRVLLNSREGGMLSCESPLDPSVDIGKNSFNMASARVAFQQAFFVLRDKEKILDTRHPADFKFERGGECILESIYDPSHPIFQHRTQSRIMQPTRLAYSYQKFPNFDDSLTKVCERLRQVVASAEEGSVFNAQKRLMGSLSHKDGESAEANVTESAPFYVISEAITREYYSAD